MQTQALNLFKRFNRWFWLNLTIFASRRALKAHSWHRQEGGRWAQVQPHTAGVFQITTWEADAVRQVIEGNASMEAPNA